MSEQKKIIKLKFYKDGKSETAEVTIKSPSMAVRDKVLIEQERYESGLAEINLRYPLQNKMIDDAQKLRKENPEITDTELQTKLTADLDSKAIAEMNKQTNAQQRDIYRLECETNLAIAKIIIDPAKLLPEQKDLFNTEIDSDFWQNTDMDEVEEAVSFFRRNNRIR